MRRPETFDRKPWRGRAHLRPGSERMPHLRLGQIGELFRDNALAQRLQHEEGAARKRATLLTGTKVAAISAKWLVCATRRPLDWHPLAIA